MGLIWWWARAASHVPWLANAAFRTPGLGSALKWMVGIAQQREVPAFARTSFRQWFTTTGLSGGAWSEGNGPGRGRTVLLWPDTFNGYLTPEPLKAAAGVLVEAGYRVEIPPKPLCCGRPLYAPGMLSTARRLWQRNIEVLQPWIRSDTPIVVAEPACASAFSDELPNLLPKDEDAKRLSHQAVLLRTFLKREGYEPPHLEGKAVLHGHCHHRSIFGLDDEQSLLQRMGLTVRALDDTCCGMAGDFGFRASTSDVAMKTGECAYLPALRDTDTYFIANGYSCREQARQATGRIPVTLPELLHAAAHKAGAAQH
jgi:Fe-S oxidoreductase